MPSSEIPSLSLALTGIAVNGTFALANTLAVLDPGGLPWFISGFFALVNGTLATFCKIGIYDKQIEARAEWRKAKYEEWLNQPVISPDKQEEWAEIDRAMGTLLDQNIDPTYERAKDYLRRERQMEQRRERRCSHLNVEHFDTSQGGRWICTDCGDLVASEKAEHNRFNPFSRKIWGTEDTSEIQEALIEQRKMLLAAFTVPPPMTWDAHGRRWKHPDHVPYCLMNNGGQVCNYPGPCAARWAQRRGLEQDQQ